MAGAIAPATLLRWHQDRPGAKAPGQRPPHHRRALCIRRVGRWPFVVPGPTGLQGTVAHGRGKRGSRFLIPPALTKALPPRRWQGPSPLPQRHAGIRTSRGPKPPASARPAPGGRFPPAGSGAGLCWSRTCRSTGHRPARAGETRVAFPVPARTDDSTITAFLAGAIAPATASRRDQDQPGAQSPRPAPAPPPAGALHPPGRALAFRGARTHRSTGHRPTQAGETRVAFPFPARTDESTATASLAGAIAPATAPRRDQDQPGAQSPRPAPAPAGAKRPPGAGRALVSLGLAGPVV